MPAFYTPLPSSFFRSLSYRHDLQLVDFGAPPTTADARARVVESMYAHARSAATGDGSLAAAVDATRRAAAEPADDHLVFLLSDANLGRYGISPSAIAAALGRDPVVTGHAIFVAEPSAADWLAAEMPPGRGFAALDAASLVSTLKQAFESAVLD